MIKIVLICILFATIVLFLRSINSELTIFALVMSGIIILYLSINYLMNLIIFFNDLIALANIDKELIKIVFKVTAIGYIVEFGAGVIEDFGLKSLSDKLVFVGKLIMLSVSIPVVYAVLNVVKQLL